MIVDIVDIYRGIDLVDIDFVDIDLHFVEMKLFEFFVLIKVHQVLLILYEDYSLSGTDREQRSGFQRLVADARGARPGTAQRSSLRASTCCQRGSEVLWARSYRTPRHARIGRLERERRYVPCAPRHCEGRMPCRRVTAGAGIGARHKLVGARLSKRK